MDCFAALAMTAVLEIQQETEKTISSFSTVTDARTNATNVFYPMDGRSFFAGVTVKF